VNSLLKGYSQEIKLLDVEQKALQAFTVYAAASMSFWRHKNFNFTHPDPELATHYLELKYIADYIKSLPDEGFLV
jgi:Ser/Thr protein kinase RdoA (MazF antagonist)